MINIRDVIQAQFFPSRPFFTAERNEIFPGKLELLPPKNPFLYFYCENCPVLTAEIFKFVIFTTRPVSEFFTKIASAITFDTLPRSDK